MDFQFNRHRSDKIQRSKILDELEKAAEKHGYSEFSSEAFLKHAIISVGTVKNEFGSWTNALLSLKEHLKNKGLDLKPRRSQSRIGPVADTDLFSEMERIWRLLGHRPSIADWGVSKPKINAGVYKYRFNGWANACLKFLEYKMGAPVGYEITEPISSGKLQNEQVRHRLIEPRKSNRTLFQRRNHPITFANVNSNTKPSSVRSIPLRLRVRVLSRDNFRCKFCGRSLATDVGVKLHIDHVKPVSKGGLSTLDNLQVLCQECNTGKSDLNL